MSYVVKTHDGQTLTLQSNDATNIAALSKKLELIPVTLANGNIIYLSKGTVARIENISTPKVKSPLLDKPDNRGTIASEKFAEAKKKLLNK